MEVERGSLVRLPSGREGFVTKHLGERVNVRYKEGDEVIIQPSLLTVLTPYRETQS